MFPNSRYKSVGSGGKKASKTIFSKFVHAHQGNLNHYLACTMNKKQQPSTLSHWLTLIHPAVCYANSSIPSQWPLAHRGLFRSKRNHFPSEIGLWDLLEEGRIWQQNEIYSHLMKDPLQKGKVQKLSIRREMKPSTLAYAKLRLFLLKNSISSHDEICSSSLSNMVSIVSFLKLLKILHQSSGDCLGPWKWVDWILAQFHKNVLKLLPNIQHATSAKMLLFL